MKNLNQLRKVWEGCLYQDYYYDQEDSNGMLLMFL